MSRVLPARDAESRESLGTAFREEKRGEQLFRSLFSVLRRGEVREGEWEEVERREDVVEVRLVGWRDGHEGGCAAKFRSGEQGISEEA